MSENNTKKVLKCLINFLTFVDPFFDSFVLTKQKSRILKKSDIFIEAMMFEATMFGTSNFGTN